MTHLTPEMHKSPLILFGASIGVVLFVLTSIVFLVLALTDPAQGQRTTWSLLGGAVVCAISSILLIELCHRIDDSLFAQEQCNSYRCSQIP